MKAHPETIQHLVQLEVTSKMTDPGYPRHITLQPLLRF